MPKDVQVSAEIDRSTKELLERHVRATGVKKGHLIEQALLHYLQALQALPADVIVHPRITLDRASGTAVLQRMRRAKPTRALKDLMQDGD